MIRLRELCETNTLSQKLFHEESCRSRESYHRRLEGATLYQLDVPGLIVLLLETLGKFELFRLD